MLCTKVVICLVILLFVKWVSFYGKGMPLKFLVVVGFEPTPFRTWRVHFDTMPIVHSGVFSHNGLSLG